MRLNLELDDIRNISQNLQYMVSFVHVDENADKENMGRLVFELAPGNVLVKDTVHLALGYGILRLALHLQLDRALATDLPDPIFRIATNHIKDLVLSCDDPMVRVRLYRMRDVHPVPKDPEVAAVLQDTLQGIALAERERMDAMSTHRPQRTWAPFVIRRERPQHALSA